MIFRKKKQPKKPKNLKINNDEKCTVLDEHADNIDERPDRISVAKDLKKIRVNTYTKALVMFITFVALIDLQLSYVLAFLGKENIAQELSIQVCVTIVAVAFAYLIRAYFDSKAEHENDPIEVDITEELEEGINNKLTSVLADAGLNVTVDAFKKKESTDECEDEPNDEEDSVG